LNLFDAAKVGRTPWIKNLKRPFMSELLFIGVVIVAVVAIVRVAAWVRSQEESTLPKDCTDSRWWPSQVATGRWEANIFQNGLEVFYPIAPHSNPVYEITITGIVGYRDWGVDWRREDACYKTDAQGNFTHWHDDVLINGRPFQSYPIETLESDRAQHRYRFRIDGPSDRLTVALRKRKQDESAGSLCVEVAYLSERTVRTSERRRLAAEASDREEQAAKAKKERSKAAARFAEQIRAICVQSEVHRNWSNQEFRDRFARTYKDELLKSQGEIRDNAIALLSRHDIVTYLRKHYPEALDRQLGKLEALLIAEDLAAGQRPQVAAPPRQRPSIGEVRDRMRRRIEISAGDRKTVLDTILRQKQEMLKDLDEFECSADERDSYITEVEEWAAGELIRLSERMRTNETYKTVG
jgi:hypothetical protein